MIRLSLFSLLFLATSATLAAQDLPSIQTDRPDQTECPFIVPDKHLQVETGCSYEQTTDSATSIVPTALWRFALNNFFELRLITEMNVNKTGTQATESGLTPITAGVKIKICEEKGLVPSTAFIGHITSPTFGSKSFHSVYYSPSFRFTMQHTLTERMSLSYNLGAEWDGFTAEPAFLYTLTTGFSLGEKTGAYAELYGFAKQKGRPDHRFDCGITYLFTPNAQLDISGGFGFSEISPDYYAALGFSFRLPN